MIPALPRAIALLSGGLDSSLALAEFLRTGGAIALALTFDYGQRAAQREAELAQRFARRFAVPWQGLALPWLRELGERSGSALLARAVALPTGTLAKPGDAASAAAVWVPARNAVFVAIAAAFAETLGAQAVLAGFNREEAATFPDNSPEFVLAATEFLRFGTRTGVEVASPTLGWDKVQIVQRARELGLGRGDFWSCYEGGLEPCGRCESCLRSSRAWDAQ